MEKLHRSFLLFILAACAAQAETIRESFTSSAGLKMIWVDSGHVGPLKAAADDEFREITITKAYYLAATEVTQAQWEAVMGNKPSFVKGADLPVEQVSWSDAMAFCQRLTEKDRAAGKLPKGYVYTLPTEMQWEYACRAGTTGNFDGPLDEMAWYYENAGKTTHPVGTKKPNEWGFYDMHGNVWEWCLSPYPTGRAGRGGCWYDFAVSCTSGFRAQDIQGGSDCGVGFRPALVSTESR